MTMSMGSLNPTHHRAFEKDRNPPPFSPHHWLSITGGGNQVHNKDYDWIPADVRGLHQMFMGNLSPHQHSKVAEMLQHEATKKRYVNSLSKYKRRYSIKTIETILNFLCDKILNELLLSPKQFESS